MYTQTKSAKKLHQKSIYWAWNMAHTCVLMKLTKFVPNSTIKYDAMYTYNEYSANSPKNNK